MRHDANIRKITILLRIIQAISDDEFVGDRESQIVCLDGFQATGRLIQEGRNAQGLGLVGEQNVAEISERQPGIKNVLN